MTQTPTIQPINIHGKDYITVADRVKLCQADEGFSMVEQHTYELAGRYFLSITIEVKGKRYVGDAEIKFTARANTPDGTNPLECAQTSALGRALGFASYGVIESIASADEVVQAERQAEPPRADARSTNGNGNGKPAQVPDTRARLKTMFDEVVRKGICQDRDEFAVWCSSVLVADRPLSPNDLLTLSRDDLQKIGAFLASEPARTGGAEAA